MSVCLSVYIHTDLDSVETDPSYKLGKAGAMAPAILCLGKNSNDDRCVCNCLESGLKEKPHRGDRIFLSLTNMFVSLETLSAYPAACLFPSHYQLA